MIDVVMPKNNEEELAKTAKKLGYASLCFLYEKAGSEKTALAKDIGEKMGMDIYVGGFGSGSQIVSFADVSKENIEAAAKNRKIDILSGFENIKAKDSLKQRNSGLDMAMCKDMAGTKKIFCIDFSGILAMDKSARAIIFGRIKQNIMLCRKYKIEVAIASFAKTPLRMRNYSDLVSFLTILGYDAGKKPFEAIEKKAVFNAGKRSGRIIAEGIEVV